MIIKINKQKGVALLFTTIILLLIAAIGVVSANKGNFIDQRSMTNRIKQAESFHTAEAGMTAFFSAIANNYTANSIINSATGAITGTLPLNTQISTNRRYSILLSRCDAAGNCPATGTPTRLYEITSIGCSDGGSYNATASLDTCYTRADIKQRITVVSSTFDFGGDTIKAKGKIDMSGIVPVIRNNSGKGVSVRSGLDTDNLFDGVPAYENVYFPDGKVESDAALVAQSESDFFKDFAGTDQAGFDANAAIISGSVLNSGGTVTCASLAIPNHQTGKGCVIKVVGDVNITGSLTLGTLAEPIVLQVTGNIDWTGAFDMRGALYVGGNMGGTLKGSISLQGKMAVVGNINATGSISATNPASGLGDTDLGLPHVDQAIGSWRDF